MNKKISIISIFAVLLMLSMPLVASENSNEETLQDSSMKDSDIEIPLFPTVWGTVLPFDSYEKIIGDSKYTFYRPVCLKYGPALCIPFVTYTYFDYVYIGFKSEDLTGLEKIGPFILGKVTTHPEEEPVWPEAC